MVGAINSIDHVSRHMALTWLLFSPRPEASPSLTSCLNCWSWKGSAVSSATVSFEKPTVRLRVRSASPGAPGGGGGGAGGEGG